MNTQNLKFIVKILENETKKFHEPLIQVLIKEYSKDPFMILIATLLSLRARDTATLPVMRVLWSRVHTPQQLLQMPLKELEEIIFSVGFYRNKALILQEVTRQIRDRFGGKVPSTAAELTSINGVGPKTANLVLGAAFDQPAICVDVHVHRISNRLGLIQTKMVEETEEALQELLPKSLWISWNYWLVIWGQNICLPRGPKCGTCPLFNVCEKKGVPLKKN